jgi:hypothetical protein
MLSQSQIFTDHRLLFIQAVPDFLYASVILILAALVLPHTESDAAHVITNVDARLPLKVLLAFWLAIFTWSNYFIFSNGKLYIRWLRLVPLDFAPDISGAKRESGKS